MLVSPSFPPPNMLFNSPFPSPVNKSETPAPASPDTIGPVPVRPFIPDPANAASKALELASPPTAPPVSPAPPNPSSVPSGLDTRLLSCLSSSALVSTKLHKQKVMLMLTNPVLMVHCEKDLCVPM